jgi:hypothetical protein
MTVVPIGFAAGTIESAELKMVAFAKSATLV